MSPADESEAETVLADLQPTRGLTIQMTALSTLGVFVAAAALSGLYQTVTGLPVTFQFAPGVGWWRTHWMSSSFYCR